MTIDTPVPDPQGNAIYRAIYVSRGLRGYLTPWHRRALVFVALIAAFCDFFQLWQNGYGNLYYAAAIRSMLESWHNFFFVSFDPGGFVTVDKPPLGFWIQAASAKLFGFSAFSILLPEALAGVLSVLVVYMLVRRVFGPAAGLLAALFLAITPVSVVTNRNNTIDSLLVLTVLLAAYAVMRAIEAGSLRWLLLSAVLVGLGFNIKMLEAYLVVPALALVYLLGAPLAWWKRLWHLAVAGLAMLAVSLSWILAVDLTPAAARPYVGSSGSNSELALALGYNGIERLLGTLFRLQSATANGSTFAFAGGAGGGPGGASENGAAGLFRLLNAQLGGQASWLLALGIVGVLASGWGLTARGWLRSIPDRLRAWRTPTASSRAAYLTPPQAALVLWGMWTLTQVVFFSVAGFFHRYYLSMLAPGIAALAGIGVILLWRDYRSQHASGLLDWRGWLLPAALVVTALTQAVILADYTGWNSWMTPLIVVGSLLAAAVLIACRALRLWPASRVPYAHTDTLAGLAGVADDAAIAGAGARWVDAAGVALADDLDVTSLPSALGAGSPIWLDERPALSRMVARLRGWTVAPLIAATLGVALLLVGPVTWVGVSLANGTGGGLVAAGPTAAVTGFGVGPGGRTAAGDSPFAGRFPAGGTFGGFGDFAIPPAGRLPGQFSRRDGIPAARGFTQGAQVDNTLVTYLEAHQGSATYLFATLSSQTAAPYIIATGKPVMALGGFSGSDQILTLSQLKAMIRAGQVKYFLLSGGFGGFGGAGGSGNSLLVQWVESHGTLVSASAYGGSAAGSLYEVSPSTAS